MTLVLTINSNFISDSSSNRSPTLDDSVLTSVVSLVTTPIVTNVW